MAVKGAIAELTLAFLVAGSSVTDLLVPRPGPVLQVTDAAVAVALKRYLAGDAQPYPAIRDTQRVTAGAFTSALDDLVGQRGEFRDQGVAVLAFALDNTWRVTRTKVNRLQSSLDPWKRTSLDAPGRAPLTSYIAQGIVAEWVASRIETAQPPEARLLVCLAAVGLAEDGHAWHRLERNILPACRRSVGDNPRFQMAGALAASNISLGPLRRDPGVLSRNDVLRNEQLDSAVLDRIPAAIASFDALLPQASLTGEVHLRAGYLELRRRAWPAALNRLNRALATPLTEPLEVASANYLAGWVLEQQNAPLPALEAYGRADLAVPGLRNLSVRRAALMFVHTDQREQAFALLRSALAPVDDVTDLIVTLERGDAHRVPGWLAGLRSFIR